MAYDSKGQYGIFDIIMNPDEYMDMYSQYKFG